MMFLHAFRLFSWVVEVFDLLICCAVSMSGLLLRWLLDILAIEDGLTYCHKMLVTNYPLMLCNIPKVRRPH